MKYRGGPSLFTEEDAQRLLAKKLHGAIEATACVDPKYAWKRSILHVWAQSQGIAAILKRTLHAMPKSQWDRCLVLCTVCPNMEGIIFKNEADFVCVGGMRGDLTNTSSPARTVCCACGATVNTLPVTSTSFQRMKMPRMKKAVTRQKKSMEIEMTSNEPDLRMPNVPQTTNLCAAHKLVCAVAHTIGAVIFVARCS